MKLKLDESLSRHLKNSLAALGHDVASVEDENLLGQADIRVAEAARGEGRMLLTLDVEFGNVVKFPPGTHPGILLFRPRRDAPRLVNRFVEDFMRGADLAALRGCIAVVGPVRTRVRWPKPADSSESK
jgi:predicted nuclease of predicted toxin-antitoxin system